MAIQTTKMEERMKLLVTDGNGNRTILNVPESSLEIIEWLEENEILDCDCTIEQLVIEKEVRLG